MAADSQATGAGQGDEAPRQSLALYRKYRPATFAEVRGQGHVTEPLRQALRSGRINHAYLFSGPRGCGKTSSARILARSLNCVNGPTPDPCGVCDSCVALAPSGPGSIDVIEIDAASHGGVDDARDLRERAFYAPVAGRFKIYIIDEAHMVTQQGFNALLKLVEEPPPHLKFIFATTEPEKVIPTIRSRTHHYPFRLMAPSVMRELAEEILASEHVPFEPAVLPLVVRAGGGSARDTLSILDQLLAGSEADGIRYDRAVALLGYTDASLLDEMAEAFAAADGAAVFRAVNRVIEGGHEPRRFATDLLDRFRDLIVLASVPDAISSGLLDVPPDRADVLKGQAERYGLASLTRAADIIAAGLDQMRGATSPRLLLELMCAQVLLPAATTDERSLLARIERLEAGAPVRPAAAATESHPERVRPAPQPPAASSGAAAPSVPPPPEADADISQPGETPAAVSVPSTAPAAPSPPPADAPPAAPFTHAPGSIGAPAAPAAAMAAAGPSAAAARGGGVTVEALRQAWPSVVEAIKAKGRVAGLMVGNASVASFDEGVLTLRFPRQGEVKGFQGSKYEELLKQALAAMFGINVVVRATWGGDTPPAGRRQGPGPAGPSGPAAGGQPSWGQPSGGQPPGVQPSWGQAAPGQPSWGEAPGDQAPGDQPSGGQAPGGQPASPGSQQSQGPSAPGFPAQVSPAQVSPAQGSLAPGSPTQGQPQPAGDTRGPGPAATSSTASGLPDARDAAALVAGPLAGSAVNGAGGAARPFGGSVPGGSGDLHPLPPPPSPDDEDFYPDDDDYSSSTTVPELTGMALVQRELGAEIIAEYDD